MPELFLDADVGALDADQQPPGRPADRRGFDRAAGELRGQPVAVACVALDHEGAAPGRERMRPQNHLGDQPERPEGPGEELGEFVAGDVLDHVAAGVGDPAVGQDDRDAENEVAQRPVAMLPGPGVRGGEQAADGGARADPGGVVRDPLTVPGQPGLQGAQRSAGPHRDGHVGRVVGQHPGQLGGVDHRVDGGGLSAPVRRGAGAADQDPASVADRVGRLRDVARTTDAG